MATNIYKPIKVSDLNLKSLYNLHFDYDIKDFPTLFNRCPDYKDTPCMCLQLLSFEPSTDNSNNYTDKIFVTITFGWKHGKKHFISDNEILENNLLELGINNIAYYTVQEIEESFKDILYLMIDETIGNPIGHNIIYKSNSFNNKTYETYFGQSGPISPSLSYKFFPDIKLIPELKDFAYEIAEYFEPEIAVVLSPTTTSNQYYIKCYYSAKGSNTTYFCCETDVPEIVQQECFPDYFTKWVKYICKIADWHKVISEIIEEKCITNVSLELKNYLNKYSHEYCFNEEP